MRRKINLLFIFLMLVFLPSCSTSSKNINEYSISKPPIHRLEIKQKNIKTTAEFNAKSAGRVLAPASVSSRQYPRKKSGIIKKSQIQLRDDANVRRYLSLYSNKHKKFVSDGLARKKKYKSLIENEFVSQGLSPELINIAHIESRFIIGARSKSGAVGMWQFMPATARAYGLKIGAFVDERKNPVKSTRAAAKYLKDLNSSFDDWLLSIAAYNAGEWGIKRAMRKCNTKDFFKLKKCSGLKKETIDFVSKFIAITLINRRMERYGF